LGYEQQGFGYIELRLFDQKTGLRILEFEKGEYEKGFYQYNTPKTAQDTLFFTIYDEPMMAYRKY